MRIRKARLSDCKLYWKWANDPIVRANAIEARPIPWQTHIAWFKEKLEDHNATLLLMEIENEPIGQVQFDHTTDGYFIDFSISSTHRNRGLGLLLVSSGIDHIKTSQQIAMCHVYFQHVEVGLKAKCCCPDMGRNKLVHIVLTHLARYRTVRQVG